MALRQKRKVEASLQKKGFEKADRDHSFFVYYTKDGKKTAVFTKTSFTPKVKDISDSLLAQMAKQCKLTKDQFCQLIDCPLSRDSYETILKTKHFVE